MRQKKMIAAWCIIMLILGFAGGFVFGAVQSMNFCLDTAQKFLDTKGVNVTVNEIAIKSDIWKYRNRIGESC